MYEQILEKIMEYLRNEVEDEDVEVTEDSNIMDDIGLSSFEIMTVLGNLEDEFHVHISDRNMRKMQTVGDMANIIVQLIEDK